MALSTCSTTLPSAPTKALKRKEYDMIKKARFFDAYDSCKPGISLRTIVSESAPSYSIVQ